MATLNETWVEAATDTGPMDVLVVSPGTGEPLPGVLHCHSFVGISDFRMEAARRLARKGFVVALPDLFHRLGRRRSFSLPQQEGDAVSAAGTLSFFDMAIDTRLALDVLRDRPDVDAARLGVVGYGMGGTVAFIAACAHRDLRAASIAYSRNIVVAQTTLTRPIAPLSMIPLLNCPLQFLSSSGDAVPSPADVELMEAYAKRYGKVFERRLFESDPPVGHAFMEEDIPGCHHAAAAEWAFRLQCEFLSRRLGAAVQ